MSDGDAGEEPRRGGEEAEVRRRRAFPLLLVALLAAWKVYEAIAAATTQAALGPSLYTLGLATFAVSLLGPRALRVATFFAGAALCLAAMAFAAPP